MPVYDLYSRRQKRLAGESPDVYTYDDVPHDLRVQILYIIEDAFGARRAPNVPDWQKTMWERMDRVLCREYGVFRLGERYDSSKSSVRLFFPQCKENDQVLDVIDLAFQTINTTVRSEQFQTLMLTGMKPDEAINELNVRFQEHAVGYQFESGKLIRVDSMPIHAEIVKPALKLLQGERYKGANEEFLKAHEHYRHGRHKECLNECLKAFESVMKVICTKRGWSYAENGTAKQLIEACLANGLIPQDLQSHFSALRSTLESGLPTVRSKRGAHGQGPKTVDVPRSVAAYALHLAATNILFLAEADSELK